MGSVMRLKQFLEVSRPSGRANVYGSIWNDTAQFELASHEPVYSSYTLSLTQSSLRSRQILPPKGQLSSSFWRSWDETMLDPSSHFLNVHNDASIEPGLKAACPKSLWVNLRHEKSFPSYPCYNTLYVLSFTHTVCVVFIICKPNCSWVLSRVWSVCYFMSCSCYIRCKMFCSIPISWYAGEDECSLF